MKINALLVVMMFLTSAMILPVGLSYAQSYGGTMQPSGNQTSMNQTMTVHANSTSTNATMIMHDNATMAMSTNTTRTSTTVTSLAANSTASQSNYTQSAQQVSDFIHSAVADFKQQGAETLKVILDCRDRVQAAAPGDIDSIKQDCSIQLNAITAKYQDERTHYHDLIKQYRSSVMVFLDDARGRAVSPATLDNAITQLGMMMHNTMSNSTVMGFTATRNNTHCVNPPGGPAIC
ncbi:MAG: hypothetical protein KGH87_03820 [Thaumarchaeota archaeon]|nr:hypothetical protein [Nitrososphaerota archaeon]MDE1839029.1 hypothetical protein [Nitrososphaerota archaeon]